MFLNNSKEKIISRLKEYDTALHCAAYLGDVTLLRAVLSTLSVQDCLEYLKGSTPTPLHVAASQARIESVRVILEYVPDPKKQNELLVTTDEEQRRPLDWFHLTGMILWKCSKFRAAKVPYTRTSTL